MAAPADRVELRMAELKAVADAMHTGLPARGNWLSGSQRQALVDAARAAPACKACAELHYACPAPAHEERYLLDAFFVSTILPRHEFADVGGALDAPLQLVVHALVNLQHRFTRSFADAAIQQLERLLSADAAGARAALVELVYVVAATVGQQRALYVLGDELAARLAPTTTTAAAAADVPARRLDPAALFGTQPLAAGLCFVPVPTTPVKEAALRASGFAVSEKIVNTITGGASVLPFRALPLSPGDLGLHFEVHAKLYHGPDMGAILSSAVQPSRTLSRAQEEFVAAELSRVNACDYWVEAHNTFGDVVGSVAPRDAAVLRELVHATCSRPYLSLDAARAAAARRAVVAHFGSAGALADAAAIIWGFSCVTRLVDGTGVKLSPPQRVMMRGIVATGCIRRHPLLSLTILVSVVVAGVAFWLRLRR